MPDPLNPMMPFLQGLLGSSLLLALGPQNIFLIRQGLCLNHPALVALVYIVVEVTLITAGALGLGKFISQSDPVRNVMGVIALIMLLWLSLRHYTNAFKSEHPGIENTKRLSIKDVLFVSIAVSLFNPLCLLDTLLLMGGLAGQYQNFEDKAWFAVGAVTTSTLWFSTLAWISGRLGFLFKKSRAARLLDLSVGIMLSILAMSLLAGLVASR